MPDCHMESTSSSISLTFLPPPNPQAPSSIALSQNLRLRSIACHLYTPLLSNGVQSVDVNDPVVIRLVARPSRHRHVIEQVGMLNGTAIG